MFFLTGLGVLRTLWLPLLELSPSTLKLGCVVYLPFSYVPHAPLVGLVTAFIGLFVFLLGVTTWFYGRFKGYEIVDFWIYRYSRHPQYLGFILWSYGLLIFVSNKVYVRGAFTTPPALIWLISTILVIEIALTEELEMKKKYGEKYE
ncbi:MAG: methyltransferase, partial [Zestosphaera sp.]